MHSMPLIVYSISAAMLVLFFLSLKVKRFSGLSSELVTLGVLGTFVGVFVGLYHFDFNAIEASIPQLLDGLKMAFVTSILGLGLYVILMLVKSDEKKDVGATLLENQERMLTLLERSFTQLSETAQINLNNQERMISGLEESLSKIAQSSQQEVVQALARVVADFNNQLNSQFGDNFRELNQAVQALNTWQSQYKSEISAMESSVQSLLIQINQVSASMVAQTQASEQLLGQVDSSATRMNTQLDTSVKIVQESLDLLLRKANAQL